MKKIIIIIICIAIFIAFVAYYFATNQVVQKNTCFGNDDIVICSPLPNQEITSPLEITGQARGPWFFEADFPVILTDWDGLIITEHYAIAQTDWMTTDFVEFKATLEFEKPELYNRGSLILKKSNPSDLPENDDALEIPIFFK